MQTLPPDFYARPVLEVARELIGCVVEHAPGSGPPTSGVIVETEAYHESEPACHAFVGRTQRTVTLFGPPAIAYVYRSYGVHAMLNAVAEPEYYGEQTSSAAPIEYIGIFVAIIMAIGSGFAAMNTMYAAVARRSREIGTLRVLGFSKGSILVSFFLEAVLLSAIGGVLGCLMVLPLNGITTRIGNSNFAETAFDFHVSLEIMMIGIAFAVLLGAIGGLFPASNAARKEILVALRQV